MADTTAETIDTLLESVQEELDDADLAFKLRTARQLVVALNEENKEYKQALKDADLTQETRDNLRELGYLE